MDSLFFEARGQYEGKLEMGKRVVEFVLVEQYRSQVPVRARIIAREIDRPVEVEDKP